MNTDLPKPVILQNLTYAGMDLLVCLEPDGNCAVYSTPGMRMVMKSDVISQCWHLAKWQIRCDLTRVKKQQ